jgi:hypothetical protein
MAKPKSHAAVAAPVLSSLTREEAESISRWLETDEGREALRRAAQEARDAIIELNESRVVDRKELYRPISMHRFAAYS